MALKLLITRLREQRRLETMSSKIVERCREALSRQVENRALEMSPAEARGYIGAKAGELIEAEVSACMHRERDLGPSAHEKLVSSARPPLVELVLAGVLDMQAARKLVDRRAA